MITKAEIECERGGQMNLVPLLALMQRWIACGCTVRLLAMSADANSAAMEALVDGKDVYKAIWMPEGEKS